MPLENLKPSASGMNTCSAYEYERGEHEEEELTKFRYRRDG
jgi:hypothetical protein